MMRGISRATSRSLRHSNSHAAAAEVRQSIVQSGFGSERSSTALAEGADFCIAVERLEGAHGVCLSRIGYVTDMANNAAKKIRLHELVIENGRSASPFVWRVRYALAHKGLEFESVRLGFIEIPTRFDGKFKTVPVLECGDAIMAESWDIIEHLDRQFPERPPLFSSPAELAMVRLTDSWFMTEVMRRMFRVYVKDLHDCIRAVDREYFRSSREKNMKGATFGKFHRRPRIAAAGDPHGAQPAAHAPGEIAVDRRQRRRTSPTTSCSAPFSGWASVSTLPLLAADDPLRGYIDRGFDLYVADWVAKRRCSRCSTSGSAVALRRRQTSQRQQAQGTDHHRIVAVARIRCQTRARFDICVHHALHELR